MPVPYEEHRLTLEGSFARAEQALIRNDPPNVGADFAAATDVVFSSSTQAYREVFLGCLLARIVDRTRNIRLPYIGMGPEAFSGRQLDEQVINPFFRTHVIPSSKGPYLSVFRRQVRFDETTAAGVRDKNGYQALLKLISVVESTDDDATLVGYFEYALYRFALLREQARVDLVGIERLSLSQYQHLVSHLLERQSGGLFPLLIVLATIEGIVRRFYVPWQVEHQDINVADAASGALGDITIREYGTSLLSIEVTERPVDVSRVQATFREKIVARNVPDYVFFVHLARIDEPAKHQAERYFAQGYEVNFVDIREWVNSSLVTIGSRGRKDFQELMLAHLAAIGVPKALKVMWNEEMERIVTS